jgi:hypothetical protein
MACVLGGVSVLCVGGTAVLNRSPAIPGLLLVFPALVAALVLLNRAWLGRDEHRWLLVAVAVFAAAVFVTQYRGGGAMEWGGRYLAVGLPVAAVLAVSILHDSRGRWSRTTVRTGVALLVVSSLLIGCAAIAALRRQHDITADVLGRVMAEAAAVEPGDGGKPVIMTENWAVARLAWPDYERFRWIRVAPAELQLWRARLESEGITAYAEVTASNSPRVVVHHLPEAPTRAGG